ncbi:hypothetical protein PQ610_05945 [Tardisphaera miroshnichenkoae]
MKINKATVAPPNTIKACPDGNEESEGFGIRTLAVGMVRNGLGLK